MFPGLRQRLTFYTCLFNGKWFIRLFSTGLWRNRKVDKSYNFEFSIIKLDDHHFDLICIDLLLLLSIY